MAIAASEPHIEAPTQETGTLPQLPETELGRRVSITIPRIAPGRYLALEDGEDVILYMLGELTHIGRCADTRKSLWHNEVVTHGRGK